MILTIFGATGMVGKQLVHQALTAGHTVKAFGRNVTELIDQDNASDKLEAIKGYVFDEHDVLNAVQGSEGVLSALGGAFDGSDKTRSLGVKNILKQMAKAGVNRIVVLGGMGVLPGADGEYLINSPDYPPQYVPVGKEHVAAYEFLKSGNTSWTFICAPDIQDQETNGSYNTAAEKMPENGVGSITSGDLAACMLEVIQSEKFLQQRVGIANT